MKRIRKIIGFTLISLSFCTNAALIIDQNQAKNSGTMASFAQSNLAQSFKQTYDNIAGAGIFLKQWSGLTDIVTISLWDALPNQAGNLLASASGLGTQGSWFDVFWNPVSVVPHTTLYLVFTSENNVLGIAGSTSNPYKRGQVYANAGYGSFASFDYTFRTYSDDNFSSVSEPASIALLGLGLAGIGFFRRKKTI